MSGHSNFLRRGTSLFAIVAASAAFSSAAFAQQATGTENVVVTGTRIVTSGVNQPTPVTVVSADQLQNTSPSSIPDGLNKLPQFDSSSTPNNATTGANGRGYNAPGNFLNLRQLGPIRTLILEDGHRVPGTFYDTTVDTDMLPQMLIQRVDIATGGGSAVYGSDAVTGVVNFVLDRKFDGLKALLQGGITQYGDAKNIRVGVAGGEDITSNSHLIWSAEYSDRDAIPDDAARKYGLLGTSIVGAGNSPSNPYHLVYNIRYSPAAPGGLATSGPFSGQQFLNNGQLAAFNPGTPSGTPPLNIGGDGGIEHNESLLPVDNKGQVFGHYDYYFNDDISAFVEARYSLARTSEGGQAFPNNPTFFPLTIFSGNPYLPASAQSQLTATGTQSFQFNRYDNDLGKRLTITQHTGALEVMTGVRGKAWGDFTWDATYTHGETRTMLTTHNNINTGNFYAALDAVTDPSTGQTVCNSTLHSPGAFPGCAPLNMFGQGNASPAALNFVSSTTSWVAHNGLDDFSANLTGTAFEGWAGPVKVAVGAEYRLASLNVTTSVPDDSFSPQNLRLAPNGTFGLGNGGTPATNPFGSYPASDLAYWKEVQSGARGSENVTEANIEFDAPLLKDLPLIEMLTVNGAYRYTQYSAAGNGTSSSTFSANTWKVGLEWQVVDDFRIRASRSRDIRAPTLWDLYQQQVVSGSGIQDPLTAQSGTINTVSGGNPDLKPEKSNQTTAGVVYTSSLVPGLNASVDYFHINIGNAIGAVNGLNPTVQNICFASGGSSPYCNLVVRPISYNNPSPANFPTLVYSLNQNIAKIYAEGVDLEVNYETDLSSWTDVNGVVNLRALWTHYPTLKSQQLPGAAITNAAGAAAGAPTGGLPSDKATFTIDYKINNFTVDFLERYDAAVHWNNDTPGIYYDMKDLRPYFQTDVNFQYDFVTEDLPLTGFLTVENVFNAQSGIDQTPGYTGSPGMNYPSAPWADILGRRFTVGLRLHM
jgi:iron complex outermembrane receptor protein